MARVRFPLLESPEYRSYAPIIDVCAGALFHGHSIWPKHSALVIETPTEPRITFAPAAETAASLVELGESWGGPDTREALRLIAGELLGPRPETPGFDCVVVTRRGCALIWFPSTSRVEAGTHALALTIAALRGIAPASPELLAMPGIGYAVRSSECDVCRAWSEALQAAKIPLVGRVAPEPRPTAGNICDACFAERGALRRQARALYGLHEDEADRAAIPTSVLEHVWSDEDFEAARRELDRR